MKKEEKSRYPHCRICDSKIYGKPFGCPMVDNEDYPLCSDECLKIYKQLWRDVNNFPNNIKNYSQHKKADTKVKREFTEEDGII